jgi:hypothetical protein
MRKIIPVIIFVLVLTLFQIEALATSAKNSEFSDMDPGHWAYESAKNMVKLGFMSKDSKGRFNPGAAITREEFAVLIVKVLDLPLKEPATETFLDIPKNSRYYRYVETAKYYFTGFRTEKGDYFRPEEHTVREDIAVTLVKALNYEPVKNYSAILKDYSDSEKISPNLKPFIASVIDNNIMVGTVTGGKKMFNPNLILTRAEAAKLFENVINREKVTYDEEEKVTYDEDSTDDTPEPTPAPPDEESYTPQVKIERVSGGLKVKWNKTADGKFSYYKVVMSKSNASPSYPDDGYVAVISDINKTEYIITPGRAYHGGDIDKVRAEQKYYITVTAVYSHGKYTGNVIREKIQ